MGEPERDSVAELIAGLIGLALDTRVAGGGGAAAAGAPPDEPAPVARAAHGVSVARQDRARGAGRQALRKLLGEVERVEPTTSLLDIPKNERRLFVVISTGLDGDKRAGLLHSSCQCKAATEEPGADGLWQLRANAIFHSWASITEARCYWAEVFGGPLPAFQ